MDEKLKQDILKLKNDLDAAREKLVAEQNFNLGAVKALEKVLELSEQNNTVEETTDETE